MKRIPLLIYFSLIAGYSTAQYHPSDEVDVLDYSFMINVNDTTDVIFGVARITSRAKRDITGFELDLIKQKSNGKGMVVQTVTTDFDNTYRHENDRIKIFFSKPIKANTEFNTVVEYRGIPDDGLIISKNKYDDRTFFADNWPNRGRNWIPVVDHPADKATVDWTIVAPPLYEVVANGIRVEESLVHPQNKITRYREDAPIATKVMVIGVARFAVELTDVISNIPVEAWVYPQNRREGFSDYEYAPKVLDFMNKSVGPYAYKKLANVQSKTTYGGLENASAIFYSESSVTGKKDHERLIAHEVAHQWFGDAVTEKEWKDVWLSEGFATYFAVLYLEHTYGEDGRREQMLKERNDVIRFPEKTTRPVIQPVGEDLLDILNANSYQKGSWVLHMLRRELGDDVFWKGIQAFYKKYFNSNASTEDFIAEMELAGNRQLDAFFKQWVYTPGHPILATNWKFDDRTGMVTGEIIQKQKNPFEFPLEVAFLDEAGKRIKIEKISVNALKQPFSIKLDRKPAKIVLDPNVNLLFEPVLGN